MAKGKISIVHQDGNGGKVNVVTFDSEDIPVETNATIKFRYKPPGLLEHDPVIFRIVETGPPTNKEKMAVDIRADES